MHYFFYGITCILLSPAISISQERVPRFTDYPAQVVRVDRSVKVKVDSTPDTVCFRSMLRKTALEGELFAGHYAFGYWGCGTECARIGIVDLISGRAYVSRFAVTGVGIKTLPDSRMVLINDPKIVGKNWGDPPPSRYHPAYLVWTGRKLLPIREKKKVDPEWERQFKPCKEMSLFSTPANKRLNRTRLEC